MGFSLARPFPVKSVEQTTFLSDSFFATFDDFIVASPKKVEDDTRDSMFKIREERMFSIPGDI
jgi:hypothetical protein